MSLNCDNTRDLVAMYMDGAVSEKTREDIRKHIAGCRECKKYYRNYKRIEESKIPFAGELTFSKNFTDIAKRMKKTEHIKLTALLSSFAAAVFTAVVLTKSLLVYKPNKDE